MLNSHKFLLLRILYRGEDIDPLVNKGLTYTQIAEMLSALIADGYLIKKEGSFALTEKAILSVNKISNKFNIKKSDWIREDIESKIDRIDVTDIYLPRKGDFNFE